MIVEYTASNVKGYNAKKILVHQDFVPTMDIINEECQRHGFIFWVTSSKRDDLVVPGAIVAPAKMGNHLVGHAVDGNLQHIKTKEFFNSKKMGDGTGEDENVIQAIVKRGVRWGGDFRAKDEVHFDDALNIKSPTMWHLKYKATNKTK